jgi:hypothetical protein
VCVCGLVVRASKFELGVVFLCAHQETRTQETLQIPAVLIPSGAIVSQGVVSMIQVLFA